MNSNDVREACGKIREVLSIRSVTRKYHPFIGRPSFGTFDSSGEEVVVTYQERPVEKYVVKVWTPKNKIELRDRTIETVYKVFGANAVVEFRFGFFITTIIILGWT